MAVLFRDSGSSLALFIRDLALFQKLGEGPAMGGYRETRSEDQMRRFARMRPEERVNLALELSSSITNIMLESIRNGNPGISTRQLLVLARRRLNVGR
jgi:hypothetical protein